MNQIFDALNFHPTTFILMTINILVVLFILNKLFYKPVGRMLEERQLHINEQLDQAAQANLNARLNELRYSEELSNARYQAKKMVNKANDIGEDMKRQIITEAKTKANVIIAKAEDEIATERLRAERDIQNEVSKLAIAAAKKVLEKEINPAEHQELIQDLLKEAGKL
jgi:F-type H+-transporting ATPase subunit b